jgi:hypothetical protein
MLITSLYLPKGNPHRTGAFVFRLMAAEERQRLPTFFLGHPEASARIKRIGDALSGLRPALESPT